MENPSGYGKVACGESFADQEAEIQDLMGDVASGQNVIVFSPRRYGKTSGWSPRGDEYAGVKHAIALNPGPPCRI